MNSVSKLFDLSGRVACVTGASSGLGRHTADILLKAGAKVVGVARREDALKDWCAKHGDDAAIVATDICDRDRLDDNCSAIASAFGSPDILVHAAGVNTREMADDVTAQGWDLSIATNLTAPFFLSQALVGSMREKRWGRIVNFASLQTYRAFPGGAAYGASKAGIAQLTRSMAEAWSGEGINVNAIAPGFFPTELTEAVFSDADRASQNAAQTCIGRNGRMEDMDGPILFLCSDACAYVTGHVLMVDGGYTAK